MTRRIAVLASGTGSNLQAVIDACATGMIAGQVVVVVSDRPGAQALVRAEGVGCPTMTLAAGRGETRHSYDTRLGDAVAASEPDIVLLAGWMRLLSSTFLDRFAGRVINLHPARPGELPGMHAIERAHNEARAGLRTRTGAMVHLVPDEGVDDGPVLATIDVPILAGDSLDDLEARVHAAEHRLIVDVLAHICLTDWPIVPPFRSIETPQEHCA